MPTQRGTPTKAGGYESGVSITEYGHRILHSEAQHFNANRLHLPSELASLGHSENHCPNGPCAIFGHVIVTGHPAIRLRDLNGRGDAQPTERERNRAKIWRNIAWFPLHAGLLELKLIVSGTRHKWGFLKIVDPLLVLKAEPKGTQPHTVWRHHIMPRQTASPLRHAGWSSRLCGCLSLDLLEEMARPLINLYRRLDVLLATQSVLTVTVLWGYES